MRVLYPPPCPFASRNRFASCPRTSAASARLRNLHRAGDLFPPPHRHLQAQTAWQFLHSFSRSKLFQHFPRPIQLSRAASARPKRIRERRIIFGRGKRFQDENRFARAGRPAISLPHTTAPRCAPAEPATYARCNNFSASACSPRAVASCPARRIRTRRQRIARNFLRRFRQAQLPQRIFRIELRDALQAKQRIFFPRLLAEKLRRLAVLLNSLIGVILFLLQKGVARNALRRLLHRSAAQKAVVNRQRFIFVARIDRACRTAIRSAPPPGPAAPCAHTNPPAPG